MISFIRLRACLIRRCNAVWAIKYAGYSAPASVSFYIVIPFVIAIAACIVVSKILKKKYA